MHVVRRDPRQFGLPGTRWTLAAIHRVCDWLGTATPGSLAHLLDRLKVGYKRGRDHVHSPDAAYLAKLASVAVVLDHGRRPDRRVVTLYLDELTYYRQPTLARAWCGVGGEQPLGERSHQSNTATRLVGALDAATGRVHYRQRAHIDLEQLVGFYRDLRAAYPRARRLYVVLDNWPVHYHPDVLAALEPQRLLRRWPRQLPPTWPTQPSDAATRRWGALRLPLQLVPLPTYASWCNPIEKLWRRLKAEVLHLHRLADDLLRYVGLLHADGSLRESPGSK